MHKVVFRDTQMTPIFEKSINCDDGKVRKIKAFEGIYIPKKA